MAGRSSAASTSKKAPKPLREFIYLDEVSLQSLLASQKGAMTEQISSEASEAVESELTGLVKGGVPGVTEAEVGSRLQAQNTKATQISRKATVQSWFGEFHALSDLRLISPVPGSEERIEPCRTVEELMDVRSHSTCLLADELIRGSLVEMRVILTADPIFTMRTFISEMAEMVEDAPALFARTDGLEVLDEAGPIRIMLQRLLVNLVPIRCRAVDHEVVSLDGKDYIVHRDTIRGLDIDTRPLDIAGVTEEQLYWRDLRRVLFSEATFTVLARVGRAGLHDTWNPVKLAQIFKDVVPDMLDQISDASLSALGAAAAAGPGDAIAAVQLEDALKHYGNAFHKAALPDLETEPELIPALATNLRGRWKTVSDQTGAFDLMKYALLELEGALPIDAETDLELRQTARRDSGLSLFPDDERVTDAGSIDKISDKHDDTSSNTSCLPAIMDVEFIAIYW